MGPFGTVSFYKMTSWEMREKNIEVNDNLLSFPFFSLFNSIQAGRPGMLHSCRPYNNIRRLGLSLLRLMHI